MTHRRVTVYAGIAVTGLAVLAACGQSPAEQEDSAPAATPTDGPAEVATLDPRIALTYDGGRMTLDTGTGEVLDEVPLDGFLRVDDEYAT